MNTVYNPKIVMILVTAKQCMEAYITGCLERYAYGPVVGAMNETISLLKGRDFPVSKGKLKEVLENLYYEADFLEQSSKPGEKRAFDIIVEAMREAGAAIENGID